MKQTTYQIKLSHACFGIVVENDIVVEVAPIAKWMKRQVLASVCMWVANKRGTINSVL